MTLIIAIDPGLSGGIAWQDGDGIIHAEAMPENMTSQADKIREIKGGHSLCYAIMERTGTYVPGNSSPAAVTFARHCGNLEAILYMARIPTVQVSPQKWQAVLPLTKFPPIPKGTGPKIKKAETARRKMVHKREIKEEMQRRYPHLRVTLKTADALGLLTFEKTSRENRAERRR
ncbi:hypothetical protein AUJ13_03570 [Candidatus Micrarchaeota archaeon CG1_02_49_24]|nr:MAG: hypothetical protein AUJ13_03570 [Candidatus Micrarchaeota archaeon CG1_02_49_24]